MNTALAGRRPFREAVAALRAEGVHVLLGPGLWLPHPPGEGGRHAGDFPWHLTIAAVQGRLSGPELS